MPINPVQFAHAVCDEFLRYLFSAFPLSDPELAGQARKLLERPSSLDIPLVQGPFISLSKAVTKGCPVQEMADMGALHPVMPGVIGYTANVVLSCDLNDPEAVRQHLRNIARAIGWDDLIN